MAPGDNSNGKKITLIFTYYDFQLLENLMLKPLLYGHQGAWKTVSEDGIDQAMNLIALQSHSKRPLKSFRSTGWSSTSLGEVIPEQSTGVLYVHAT